ncbi:MAG TPA: SDR family NAD(P)-dependent oxidoreductase [Gemmatimonadales bacterium]|jgi:NAD(P)-dependent dehydrogenase (short-subunit alcohol dehydrogenase family)
MPDQFKGQQIVITGGDGGLGTAVVDAFIAAGATCHLPTVGDVPPPKAGVQATGHVNLTDEAEVERYYASLPAIAASVHLAGGFLMKAVVDTTGPDLQKQLAINLFTTFYCCREAVKKMRSSGGGRIVNVGARVVEAPSASMVAYTAAKGAVTALTRALAAEVLPDNILVNAVLPSIIDTPANRAAMPNAKFDLWPKAEELAQAIVWLASMENTLTSGALLPVYGTG